MKRFDAQLQTGLTISTENSHANEDVGDKCDKSLSPETDGTAEARENAQSPSSDVGSSHEHQFVDVESLYKSVKPNTVFVSLSKNYLKVKNELMTTHLIDPS
jgi:hypothetical protein